MFALFKYPVFVRGIYNQSLSWQWTKRLSYEGLDYEKNFILTHKMLSVCFRLKV